MNKPVLVVLAAGLGSRYGGLKQMDSMGAHGQVIIDYSIYDARRAGFEDVVFIITKSIEQDFRDRVGDRISRGIRTAYAYQDLADLPAGYSIPSGRTKPWGTTHALLSARQLVDGPFAVINADDYYGPDAFQTMYQFLSSHTDPGHHAMVGYPLCNTLTENGAVTRGICHMDSRGFLTDITERTNIHKEEDGGRFSPDGGSSWVHLPGDTLVSMNFWGFQSSFLDKADALLPELLDQVLAENPERGEVFLPLVVDRLTHGGSDQVEVLSSRDQWFGVTYQEDKPFVISSLRRLTQQGVYPENLWGI